MGVGWGEAEGVEEEWEGKLRLECKMKFNKIKTENIPFNILSVLHVFCDFIAVHFRFC